MRKPDSTETLTWKGFEIQVSKWCDPTDLPYDGDVIIDEGTEGWDLLVEVSLQVGVQYFTSGNSLGSCWGDQEYIRECFDDQLIPEALSNLEAEIRKIADGRDVDNAKKTARLADMLVDEWDAEQLALGN